MGFPYDWLAQWFHAHLGIVALVFITEFSTQATRDTDATLVLAIMRSTRHVTLAAASSLPLRYLADTHGGRAPATIVVAGAAR